jgi:hypothetical protein
MKEGRTEDERRKEGRKRKEGRTEGRKMKEGRKDGRGRKEGRKEPFLPLPESGFLPEGSSGCLPL